jgi:hypothetical protein
MVFALMVKAPLSMTAVHCPCDNSIVPQAAVLLTALKPGFSS